MTERQGFWPQSYPYNELHSVSGRFIFQASYGPSPRFSTALCFRSIVAQQSFRLKLCSVKCIVHCTDTVRLIRLFITCSLISHCRLYCLITTYSYLVQSLQDGFKVNYRVVGDSLLQSKCDNYTYTYNLTHALSYSSLHFIVILMHCSWNAMQSA